MNRDEKNIAQENVERLLSRVYTPQSPEAPFAERVRAAMQATAAKISRGTGVSPVKYQDRGTGVSPVKYTGGTPVPRASESLWDRKQLSDRAVLASWAVAGAIILGIFMIGRAFSPSNTEPPVTLTNSGRAISIDWNRDLPDLGGQPFITAADRPAGAEPQRVQIGQEIQTQRGERRRVVLPDGSVLYIDAETKLRLDDQRRVTLSEGRIFVNVSPREESATDDAATFIVQTPDRRISALGTRFAVDVDEREDRILVTQGKVKVDGLREEIHTGQQVILGRGERADDVRVTAAPRASHALDWTKDLMSAAEARLVPESDFAGGALLVEHEGEKTRFTLRKYHVDVHIEDGFARTTIDQTYFNHLPQRLEGTFYFPLPPDASISRLAMYVAGKRMEGGMLERNRAREVFESIKYRMLDPALLEWIDGSTFKMRVFPLEGRQEKRIILSYTQRLDSLYGRTSYRFPAGHNLGIVDEWTLKVHVRGHADKPWTCRSHEVTAHRNAGNLTLVAKQTNTRLDRDVVIDLYDSGYQTQMAQSTKFSSTRHENSQYLMLRHRPNLPTQQKRQRRDWVFLFESSGDRNPLLARAQIDVIRGLLENAEHDDTFSIATASTQLHRLTEQQTATQANIAAAMAKLEQTHLVGALDLAGALRGVKQITDPLVANGNPHLVHVGSGVPIMGERDAAKLAALVPEGVRYVGIGVGKRWSRSLMKQAAARTGGYYTQINPDEEIAWRAFDLLATLNTPRLLDVQVKDSNGRTWLCDVDSLAQGETLAAVTRWPGDGGKPPRTVTVTGKLNGEAFSQEFAINMGTPQSDYLPRTWAKLEIDRMLALDAAAHRAAIVKLSKAMYVMSPYTSLLVLENEAMYKQYKVDRGRKDHWALYPAPDTIPVVHEPLYGRPRIPFVELEEQPKPPKNPDPPVKKEPQGPSAEDILRTIVIRSPAPVLIPKGVVAHGSIAATAWDWLGGYDSGWRYDPRNPGSTSVVGWQTSAYDSVDFNNATLGYFPRDMDFDYLIALIQATIQPNSWDEVAGPGNIDGFENNLNLVVSQTQRVHEQISGGGFYETRPDFVPYGVGIGSALQNAYSSRALNASQPDDFDRYWRGHLKVPYYDIPRFVDAPPAVSDGILRTTNAGQLYRYYSYFNRTQIPGQHDMAETFSSHFPRLDNPGFTAREELDRWRDVFLREQSLAMKEKDTANLATEVESIQKMKPKASKELFSAMLKNDELDRVVKILFLLPIAERSKIVNEFKTQEDLENLDTILERIETGGKEGEQIRTTLRSLGGVAEPTLVTRNGHTARFIADGEFAVPTMAGNHQEWQLGFTRSLPLGMFDIFGKGDNTIVQHWIPEKTLNFNFSSVPRNDRNVQFDRVVVLTDLVHQLLAEQDILAERNGTLLTDIAKYKDAFKLMGTRVDDLLIGPLRIDGVVLTVGQEDLLEISIGGDDGLKKGQQLYVYRDNKYLGEVEVLKTTPDKAVARIKGGTLQSPIRKGDLVASSLDAANAERASRNATAIQHARQRSLIAALRQAQRSAIPFQDELPLIYPDAELWRELTLRRNKFAAIDLHGLPPWEYYRPNVNAHWNFNPIDAFVLSRIDRDKRARKEYSRNQEYLLNQLDLTIDDDVASFRVVRGDMALFKRMAAGAFGVHTVRGDGRATPPRISTILNRLSLRPEDVADLRRMEASMVNLKRSSFFAGSKRVSRGPRANFRPPEEVVFPRVRGRSLGGPLSFSGSQNTFRDLLSYAPSMNTSRADVLAVLEEEGRERIAPQGKVDRRAQALLDKAKAGGWFALTLPIGKDEKLVVRFDLAGRYVYERRTADGLRERVICDGRTLWHLYPEIGVGAKRPVSRHHRRWLAAIVPWLAPLAEDLARGADVRWVDERTIAIVPHGWEHLRSTPGRAVQFVETRLVFAEDGRLIERRRVVVPTGQILLRVKYSADGSVVWMNGKDKQLASAKLPVTKAAAPSLNPETNRLVVVPMPLRTVESLRKTLGEAAKPASDWDEDAAISMIAAHCASGSFRAARRIVGERFYSDEVDDRRLGFNTLLLAAGQNDNSSGANRQRVEFQPEDGNVETDLKDYLVALVGGKLAAADGEDAPVDSSGVPNDFVRQLAQFHNLTIDLQNAKAGEKNEKRRDVFERGIEFVNEAHSPRFAWAIASQLNGLIDDPKQHAEFAAAYERFEHVGPLAGEAVHQRALHSLSAGDAHAARNHFDRWYAAHLAWGVLPALSKEFYQAHQQDGALDEWRKLVDAVAKLLRAASHPASVVQLAEQCRAAGDGPLADRLVIYVLAGVSDRDRLPTTLAAVRYYTAGKDDKRAAKLVDGLLEDERLARWPSLWRLAATMADRVKKPARALTFAERALELTYKSGDEKIELEALRRDYNALMDRYAATAEHLAEAKQHPPQRLVDRLVRAADRWRSLEVDVTAPCQRASQVLRLLGEHDLAWAYLTTPLAMRPNEAQPWNDMAVALHSEGDIDLAVLAYTAAFDAEETNAHILWDHAEMLEGAGRKSEARELYVQIAESKWGRAFLSVQNRARAKVK